MMKKQIKPIANIAIFATCLFLSLVWLSNYQEKKNQEYIEVVIQDNLCRAFHGLPKHTGSQKAMLDYINEHKQKNTRGMHTKAIFDLIEDAVRENKTSDLYNECGRPQERIRSFSKKIQGITKYVSNNIIKKTECELLGIMGEGLCSNGVCKKTNINTTHFLPSTFDTTYLHPKCYDGYRRDDHRTRLFSKRGLMGYDSHRAFIGGSFGENLIIYKVINNQYIIFISILLSSITTILINVVFINKHKTKKK